MENGSDTYAEMRAENAELRERLEYAQAENQVWRMLIADVRESVVQISQSYPQSKGFKRVRECMAYPDVLDAEVQKLLALRRKAAAEPEPEPLPKTEGEPVPSP